MSDRAKSRGSRSKRPLPGGERCQCAIRALPIIAASALLSACSSLSILSPVGPVGEGNRQILFNALAIMLAIVVPTMIAIGWFAWWFRAGNRRAIYRPEFTFSGRIELVVWSVPLMIILFLGGVIWIGSHRLDPRAPIPSVAPPLDVQVVSLDWKWLFIYPGQRVASVNRLVLPVGTPVRFRLTSASVMNAFFVPRLGSMIYAMNGMESALNLRADQPGSFYGQSAHFSGDGFADMNFMVQAVSPAEFAAWVGRVRRGGGELDPRSYAALARPSQGVPPRTFGTVTPGLFDAVVSQRLAPAPGPQEGRGGPQVSPGTPE